ncbi:MAG: hypothetical protein ABS98_16915 [Lysobacteraceae bacterium SCN 69-48]|nr:MAG: hypothetical protein ABS98_16915 [Xanthomonadaceae bacterium SCN 69-48]
MDRFPRFAPRLVYARTNDGFDYGGVGISVDLPVFDTNRAEKQKREAEASAARATATYFSSDSFAQEVGYLSKAIGATYSQSEITRSEVVPALEEALRTFKQRLQSGQAALPQIWQTIQAVNEARQTALDLFVKAATARAELSVMVGEDV